MDSDTLRIRLKILTRDLYFPHSEFLKDQLFHSQSDFTLLQAENRVLLTTNTMNTDMEMKLATVKGDLATAREKVEKLEDDLMVEKKKCREIERERDGLKVELEKIMKQNKALQGQLSGKNKSRAGTPSKVTQKPPVFGLDKSLIRPFTGALTVITTESCFNVPNRRKTGSADLSSSFSRVIKCE